MYSSNGDIMRIYYIFLIKKEIVELTKTKPYNLYKMLENIYLMNNDYIVLGYKTFEKLCKVINKNNFSKLIKDINKDNLNYTCFNNTHLLNDFLKNETTKLIINNSHMKLKSNVEYPSFLKDVKNIPNLFVCDFINMDYFYIKDILVEAK